MKKIFTVKRVILIMALALIYFCAFLFVRIYAEKSILSAEMPDGAELIMPKEVFAGIYDPLVPEADEQIPETEAVTFAEPVPEPESEPSEPVEYIVNKLEAGKYPMLLNVATSVSDAIEPATTTEAPTVTTAPTTTETPTTTTKKTEAVTTTTPATTPPPTTTTELSTEEAGSLAEFEDEEVDDREIAEDKEDAEAVEEPEGDGFIEMTDEELQELLERLGLGSIAPPSEPAPGNPGDILISGNSYKNQTVTFYDTSKKQMRTGNAFDIVCEITNYEVGESMEPEAIKAQAVAVYTYLKYYEQKGEYAEIGSKSDVPQIIRECVEAVDGLAIYYDGKYIMSAFSASTGGFSAASKNVWGGDLPYLQSVANDFDYLDSKNYGRVTTYTVEEIREKIESKTDIRLSNNYSEWIRILSNNDNIYAGQLSIDGHTTAVVKGKERTLTGHVFRTYILNIRSTAFNVSYADGVFTFTTYGYGHGVGMSQVGANLYAKYGGYTFDQILHHYYTGVTIQ